MDQPPPLLNLAIHSGGDARHPFTAVLTVSGHPSGNPVAIPLDRYRALHDLVDGYRQLLKTEGHPDLAPMALDSLGVELFHLLLSPFWSDVEGVLETAGAAALVIASDNPEIHLLPWELAKPPSGPLLGLDPRLALRRSAHPGAGEALPALFAPIDPPLRVLFMACAPTNSGRFDHVDETNAMIAVLSEMGAAITMETPISGTFADLSEAVERFCPHVVHLSGPALIKGERGFFGFEDASGEADILAAEELAQGLPLESPPQHVPLFILSGRDPDRPPPSAALGVLAQGMAGDAIPLTLSWPVTLTDPAAAALARTFYQSLAAGSLPDAALLAARQALLATSTASGRPDWTLPVFHAPSRRPLAFDGQVARPAADAVARASHDICWPLPGLADGYARPHFSRRRENQRLLPPLRAGHLQMALLSGPSGCGKSTLAAHLASLLAADGFQTVALGALPSAPLSTARILAVFEEAFRIHGLDNELEILTNPRIGVEDRLGFLVAVMNRRFPFVLVLDGLDSALDPETGAFLEAEFAAFYAYLKEQLNGMSRVIVTSRRAPSVAAPAPSPATFREETVPPLREPGHPGPVPVAALDLETLTPVERTALSRCGLFPLPMPLSAMAAVTALDAEGCAAFLDAQQQTGRIYSLPRDDMTVFSLETSFRRELQRQSPCNEQLFSRDDPEGAARLAAAEHLSESMRHHDAGSAAPSWLDLALTRIALLLQTDQFASALLAAEEINGFLAHRGFLWEQERLNRALLAVQEHPHPLYMTATVLLRQDRRAKARGMLQRLIGLSGAFREKALAWFDLASLDILENDLDGAGEKLQKARELNADDQNLAGEAGCLAQMGFLLLRRNRADEALERLESALTLYRQLDSQQGMARLLPWCGDIRLRQGDLDRAQACFQEALPLLLAMEDEHMAAQMHHQLATIDLNRGNLDQSIQGFRQSLILKRKLDDRQGEAAAFFQLGRLAKARNDQMGCLQLLGLCQRIGHEIGDADAEKELQLFNELTRASNLTEAQSTALLDEAWSEYCQDRAEVLLARIFPD